MHVSVLFAIRFVSVSKFAATVTFTQRRQVRVCHSLSKDWLRSHVINIGTSKETAFGDVLKMIESILERKVRCTEGTYDSLKWQNDCWAMNIDYARKHLGWKPKYTLESGLEREIKWIRSQLQMRSSE